MKKQNLENKLVFNKTAVAELNEKQLKEVNGGGSKVSFILPTIVITFV